MGVLRGFFATLRVIRHKVYRARPFNKENDRFLANNERINGVVKGGVNKVGSFLSVFFYHVSVFRRIFGNFASVTRFLPYVFGRFILLFCKDG